MGDDLSDFMARRTPTADRPLLGLTVLVVEDSRYACEALRLMCLRSGARIRRADCIASARRHLQCYRPAIVIVDLGLPDGSGLDLIAEIAGQAPRRPALLATSGEPSAVTVALSKGADGFLAKPYESLAAFQQAALGVLPAVTPPGRQTATLPGQDRIEPDPMALRDDLTHVAALLRATPDRGTLGYVAQFLSGVALSAHDDTLGAAAEALASGCRDGGEAPGPLAHISGLVQDRLAATAAI
ncbi:MAG: response regulator [Rhodobacteraceae bacterium]|nr:response regulator [Paracoccaceae bacterium]